MPLLHSNAIQCNSSTTSTPVTVCAGLRQEESRQSGRAGDAQVRRVRGAAAGPGRKGRGAAGAARPQ